MLISESGIYRIRNLVNNKFYIGSAVNLNKRKSQHFYYLRNNKHHNKPLQNSFNKYKKDNFIFEIMCYCHKEDLILNEYNNALYKRNQRISLQHINGDISESILKGVSPDGKVQILHNNVEEEYIHGMVRILYDR